MASVAAEAHVSKALVHYYFATGRSCSGTPSRSPSSAGRRRSTRSSRASRRGGKGRADPLVSIEPALPFSEQRALGNEVWSSLRSDEELRPVVERSYARGSIASSA